MVDLRRWLSRRRTEENALVVEADSPALVGSSHVAEAISLEAVGGTLAPVMKSGRRLPCSAICTLTTAADGQDQITFSLFRGNVGHVAAAHRLGTFRVENLPGRSRGVAQVELRLSAREQDLWLDAREPQTRRQLRVIRVD